MIEAERACDMKPCPRGVLGVLETTVVSATSSEGEGGFR